MKLEEKIELLEDILEMDEGDLNVDMELEDMEEWDSLSKLSLMAEIRRLTGKTISTEEIHSFNTVQDICDYLG